MSRFDVVVPHIAYIVFQVVQHRRAYVGGCGVDEVIIISHGLPLQDVSVIHQQDVFLTVLLALFVEVSRYACQASLQGLAGDEVIREISSVGK